MLDSYNVFELQMFVVLYIYCTCICSYNTEAFQFSGRASYFSRFRPNPS